MFEKGVGYSAIKKTKYAVTNVLLVSYPSFNILVIVKKST